MSVLNYIRGFSDCLTDEAAKMRMAKLLTVVPDLSNAKHRTTAYEQGSIPSEQVKEYDAEAVRRETIRRSISSMREANAQTYSQRLMALDTLENTSPERVSG